MNKVISLIIRRFSGSKEAKNASWLIAGKMAQMVLSLFVGLLSARYLGPGNFGLVNYGASYVGLFSSLCSLGINSVIIKELDDRPEEQGTALGTAIVLRIAASLLSILMITAFVCIVDRGEPITIAVTVLCSLSLLFHVFDTINYWFQYRYASKVTAKSTLAAYVIVSAYKITLLALGMDVRWFAFSTSVDYIMIAVFQLLSYRKHGGQRFAFSMAKAKRILGKSYHYILAGMMVAVYAQTDKLMLKQMLDEVSVGYYSTATTICNMWVFVLAAVIDSVYPSIIRLFNSGEKTEYERKNVQLYAIVFYVSASASLGFILFGRPIVRILYGEAYLPAVMPLKIVTCYTAFSYLGVARNAWIVCENKQKYLKYIYVGAAVTNVIINAVFIPLWGATGAAVASLITQMATCLIFPWFLKELRENAKLMLDAIMLKGLVRRS